VHTTNYPSRYARSLNAMPRTSCENFQRNGQHPSFRERVPTEKRKTLHEDETGFPLSAYKYVCKQLKRTAIFKERMDA
jgi:hypothetical protein